MKTDFDMDIRAQQHNFHKEQNDSHYRGNKNRARGQRNHQGDFKGYRKSYGTYSGYHKNERDVELTPDEIRKREILKNQIQERYFDNRFIIVDSNIFMDKSSDWFFDMIKDYFTNNGEELEMFAEQYLEMNNRKNNASWNTPIRKVATKALQRVEQMIDDNICRIINLDNAADRDKEDGAYADGIFFEEISKTPDRKYTIISRDLDLRIRIKNKFRDIDCIVLNLKDCDYRNI